MAVFNPNLPDVQPPSPLHYSQGTKPDVSKATLIGATGEGIELAAKAGYGLFKEVIREEATDKVDLVRDATIKADWQGSVVTTTELPAEISREKERLSKRQLAVKAGVTPESYYWMQLDATSRSLRAKYPGFREEIDNIMADLTGSTPANALRKALYTEAMTRGGSRDKEADRLTQTEDWAAKHSNTAYKEYIALKAAGKNPDVNILNQLINRDVVRTTSTSIETNELALRKSKNDIEEKQNKEDSISLARKRLNDVYYNNYVAEVGGMDTIKAKLEELRTAAATGLPVDSAKVAQAQAVFASKRARAIAEARAALYEDFPGIDPRLLKDGDTSRRSYAGLINDSDQIEKLMNSFIRQIDQLGQDINSGHYNIAAANVNLATEIRKGNLAALLQKYPELGKLDVLRETVGPVLLERILQDSKAFNTVTKALLDIKLGEAVSPGGSDLSKLPSDLKSAGVPGTKEYYRETIDRLTKLVADKSTSPTAIEPLVKTLFSDNSLNFLRNVGPSELPQVFTLMSTPDIAKNIKQISDARGTPQLFEEYRKWTIAAALMISRTPIVDYRDLSINVPSPFGLKWDDDTHSFTPSKTIIQGWSGLVDINTRDRISSPNWQLSVRVKGEELNNIVKGLIPVYRAEGLNKEQINTNLKAFFGGLGLNLDNLRWESKEEKNKVKIMKLGGSLSEEEQVALREGGPLPGEDAGKFSPTSFEGQPLARYMPGEEETLDDLFGPKGASKFASYALKESVDRLGILREAKRGVLRAIGEGRPREAQTMYEFLYRLGYPDDVVETFKKQIEDIPANKDLIEDINAVPK